MARRIHLQPYLSIDELEHRYRTAKEPNERTWWQILWLLAQGRTATELSAVIGYRAYWIGQYEAFIWLRKSHLTDVAIWSHLYTPSYHLPLHDARWILPLDNQARS